MGKTLVLGASPVESRFSYKAVKALIRLEEDVVAVGKKSGEIKGLEIQTGMPQIDDVDTVLLYVGEQGQSEYYDYLIGLQPRRIIFNPGTRNKEFEAMCTENGIEAVADCALIMLNSGEF